MLDGGDVRRGDTIEIQRRFGLVDVVDDFDLERIVVFEVLAVDGNLHAAEKHRLEIDARFHQRALRFGRVQDDLGHPRTNECDEPRREQRRRIDSGLSTSAYLCA